MTRLQNIWLAMILVGIITTACQNPKKVKETVSLGEIELSVTSNSDGLKHFEQGVLLLHSFMYQDAAKSFRQAQEADPDFAMAYWGEAMTYNHPLWSEQNYDKGVETLTRLAGTRTERKAKAPTELEQDFLEAAEILYGDGTKIERDDLYAEHMGNLYEKYPGNHEVAAFYALALLGSVEEGRDYEVYGKGAQIAEGILSENPKHPGALHYLIHSYDDPDHAPLAINAANSYSEVAPDAGHALHMPSHIYIAMGMWDEVISSNIRSYEAKLKRVAQNDKLSWNLHAYHWLLYGYLQKNDLQNAKKIMSNMIPYIESNKSTYTRYYFIEMLGNYMAETGNWDNEFSGIRVDTEDLNVQSQVSQFFLEGFMALKNGDRELAVNKIDDIETAMSAAAAKLVTKGITVCSGVSFASRTPSQSDIDMSEVMLLELKAALAIFDNEEDTMVEELLKKATLMESNISFNFGPPAIVIPTYELYGDWLAEKGRFEEALLQYDKSLEKGPKRRLALEGKLKIARKTGQRS